MTPVKVNALARHDFDTYETSVNLSGVAFVPTGSMCCVGPSYCPYIPPTYDITARNTTTGQDAYAKFHLGCLRQVNVLWDAWLIQFAPALPL